MKIKYLIIFFVLLLVLGACKKKKTHDEGTLVYKITYLESKSEKPIIALLPDKVEIKYKNNNRVIIVKGFWGTFEMRFVTNYNEKKNYTILYVAGKKYYVEVPIDSMNAGYEAIKDLKIQPNPNDTATIEGLLCYSANVINKTISDSVLKFYYTYDINIKDPNLGSPYKDIDGVLTEFTSKIMSIRMYFQLVDVIDEPIDDKEFELPKGYKKLSRKEFEELLKSFDL